VLSKNPKIQTLLGPFELLIKATRTSLLKGYIKDISECYTRGGGRRILIPEQPLAKAWALPERLKQKVLR
jgi:hypothetical protein